jgi:hypothetical protein
MLASLLEPGGRGAGAVVQMAQEPFKHIGLQVQKSNNNKSNSESVRKPQARWARVAASV